MPSFFGPCYRKHRYFFKDQLKATEYGHSQNLCVQMTVLVALDLALAEV